MYSLNEVFRKCEKQLDDLGIKYGKISRVSINNKATNTWGRTIYYTDGRICIQISSTLLDEKNPKESLENTVMHELLHTCKGCDSHKGKWKEYAEIVNKAYGYHITRTNSAEDLGIVARSNPKKIKHSFVCNGCGCIVNRQRESAFTRDYEHFRCVKCGGTFTKLF